MEFNRLVYMRETLEFSQREMAKALNVSKSNYARWETTDKIIPLKHLVTMCNITKTSLDFALNLSNNKTKIKENISIDNNKIGKKIKDIRIKKNLSQKEFAKSINTTQSVISSYENGKVTILTAFLYDIAKKYKISADCILK